MKCSSSIIVFFVNFKIPKEKYMTFLTNRRVSENYEGREFMGGDEGEWSKISACMNYKFSFVTPTFHSLELPVL